MQEKISKISFIKFMAKFCWSWFFERKNKLKIFKYKLWEWIVGTVADNAAKETTHGFIHYRKSFLEFTLLHNTITILVKTTIVMKLR